MAWLAHGSDYGGSLRSPTTFCSIVGMRPSRKNSSNFRDFGSNTGCKWSNGKKCERLTLFFDVLLGQTYKDPTSIPKEEKSFLDNALEVKKPRKVAISQDLDNSSSRHNNKRICCEAGKELEKLGIVVEEASPDLSDAPYTSQILRAFSFYVNLNTIYRK